MWGSRLTSSRESDPLPESLRGIGPGAQECLLVLCGGRDTARIIVPAGMVAAAVRRAHVLGLAAVPSPFLMRTIPIDSKRTYSDNVVVLPKGVWDAGAKVFVYLSRDADMVLRAWASELLQNDAELGRLFGYPQCCIAAFNRKDEFKPKWVDNNVGYAPILTNQYSRLFGFEIISHKPCALDCRETLILARRNLRALRSISPTASSYLMDVLSSPVLVIDSMNFIMPIGYRPVSKHKFEALSSELLSIGMAANDLCRQIEHRGKLVTFQAIKEGLLIETAMDKQLLPDVRLILHKEERYSNSQNQFDNNR